MEQIVISGIAGRFPKCRNLSEFKYNLYNKIDMITDKQGRWPPVAGLPPKMGMLDDLDKFDSLYFGVHSQQVNAMDPQLRFLLELTVEAMFDAGINPAAMRNSRTNVYVSVGFPDASFFNIYDKIYSDMGSVYGSTQVALANRLSYQFNFSGTSMVIDTACSGFLVALLSAYNALQLGQCDAAIVAGVSVISHPSLSIIFNNLAMISPDGYCKPFDNDGKGFARSEAVEVIILQRKSDAKRIYADIVHIASNTDGFKQEGFSFPSKTRQKELFENFYKEINVHPNEVEYIEMHGTATNAGDPVECWSVDQAFNKCCRQTPLLIGSVKSNLGHAEAASSSASISKAIFAFETGLIAPTMHYKAPNKNIPSLCEGKLKVCTEITPLGGQYIAINAFGIGGVNAHLLLTSSSKLKVNNGCPDDKLPRLILWSGRTEDAVKTMFDHIESQPLDAEFIGLTHEIQTMPVHGHMRRGYGIYKDGGSNKNAICLDNYVTKLEDKSRPVVWMFSGMGSQWPGMINGLMKIKIFRETIEKCHNILVKHQYDLISIFESTDPKVVNDIINSMVMINAIEIGLIEVLKSLNIPMDYLIGHSLGETAVGYADESLTLEQTILCAYIRAVCSKKAQLIDGRMYAVGLGYKDIEPLLPEEVYCACRNSSTSSTISGPTASVEKFVAELRSKKVFVKEVNTDSIPYHSRYINPIAELMYPKVKEIIPQPKKRSSKWLSSCYHKNDWEKSCATHVGAEYLVQNLVGAVLFEDVLQMLPEDAIVLEIAPCGLLQAIVKRELPNDIHVPLLIKNSSDNSLSLMKALGKLYASGINMEVQKLYPEIQFPVSANTAMIAPLIKWDHSQSWRVPTIAENQSNDGYVTRKLDISLSDPLYQYMEGHIIDDRCLLPGTGYLNLVRETFIQSMTEHDPSHIDVEFENILFVRATMLSKSKTVELTITINRTNGHFKVLEDTSLVASGIIRHIRNAKPVDGSEPRDYESDCIELNADDFYRDLRIRGYTYEKEFCAIQSARTDGRGAKITWSNNWTTFMDNMLQSQILTFDSRSLVLPTSIRHVRINTQQHLAYVEQMKSRNDAMHLNAYTDMEINSIRCGGIEITGLLTSSVNRRNQPGVEAIDRYEFVPLTESGKMMSRTDCARVVTQLIIELSNAKTLKAIEVHNNVFESQIENLQQGFSKLPQIFVDFKLFQDGEADDSSLEDNSNVVKALEDPVDLIVMPDFMLKNESCMQKMMANIAEDGFLMLMHDRLVSNNKLISLLNDFNHISHVCNEKFSMSLLRKKSSNGLYDIVYLKSDDMSFEWLHEAQEKLKSSSVLIVSENEKHSGLIGLTKCLAREANDYSVQCLEIDDKLAPKFDIKNPHYAAYLRLNLPFNIYRNGKWGTYRHLSLEKPFRIETNLKSTKEVYNADINQIGNLSTLTWTQSTLSNNTKSKLIKICYSALNFRDVMIASGRLSLDFFYNNRLKCQNFLGFEYSGIDANGKRIFGLRANHGIATHAHSENENILKWNVPDSMSLRDAATIPAVYMTVYYAFFCRATIRAGQSILIHAGCGGIGLSAIRVAFAYGLNVFTTVSTDEKKNFLLKTFPQLKRSQIGNSRDCSFEKMIMKETNGVGVDIVLNSLSEDKLIASARCVSCGGTFLEIGKFDIFNNSQMGMRLFAKEISFIPIFADRFEQLPIPKIHQLIEDDLRRGIVQPLPSTVFEPNDLEKAFKYLGSGKHIGKVMIQVRRDADQEEILPMKISLKGVFKSNRSYVVIGGLGDFGMEFIDWMVIRGARKVMISSRRQPWNSYQLHRIEVWRSYGCEVMVSNADVTSYGGCEQLLSESNSLGEIAGIFNLAVVLRDKQFESQTIQSFQESLAPKAVAMSHLDILSRKMCPHLEHFVVFSSVSCGLGNAGQTNYGMANAVMERIIESRCNEKLPGKAIQWGAIGDVGAAYKLKQSSHGEKYLSGFGFQNINNCLNVLDTLLMSSDPVVASYIVAQKIETKKKDLLSIVLGAMGITDVGSTFVSSTMTELGMDSLVNNEVKQLLKRDFDIEISTENLRELTVKKLIEMSQKVSKTSSRNGTRDEPENKSIIKVNSVEDSGKECILFIPGHEGVMSKMTKEFCEKLSKPTYALQFHHTRHLTTVQSIVENLSKEIVQLHDKRKTFQIIAYSFGSVIAVEIARSLEKIGLTGKLCFIDGSPQIFSAESMNKNFTLFNQLNSFHDLPTDVLDKCNATSSFESKVSIAIEYFDSQKGRKYEHLKEVYSSTMSRFKICTDTCTTHRKSIKSDIRMIRASQKLNESDDGVELLTSGNVEKHEVKGTHFTVMNNEVVAELAQKS